VCARFRANFSGTLYFPLTTKSTFNYMFQYNIRFRYWLANVAHFFPSHSLHLDLTFWAVPISLTISPSQGKLTTAVYRREGAREGEVERGVSVLEQAPLGGFKAPPGPLGFKLTFVVPWRMWDVIHSQCLRLSIVGYLIPVCFLAFVGSGKVRATFVAGLHTLVSV